MTIQRSTDPIRTPDRTPLVSFKPTTRNPLDADLFELDEAGEYGLTIRSGGSYYVNTNQSLIRVYPGPDDIRTEERLWGLPMLLAFLSRGDLPLHGSSAEVDGRALIFCAPSKHGKTTLAAGFHRAGHRLLSEDLSCVRLGTRPSALPGPASLRVRHDIVDPLDLIDVDPLTTDDERVHFAIQTHRRGTTEPVALGGIVLLKDSSDGIEISRVEPVEAIRDLWFLSFNLPNEADRQRCFTALTDLSSAVPVWNLTRPMTITALDETIDRLAQLAHYGS